MPTISRSLVQPLVTPSTALLTSARASPCTAACASSGRIATRLPSFCSIVMPDGRDVSSLPFGPWTITVLPSILTVTPFGIAIGFFQIRDISRSSSFAIRYSPFAHRPLRTAKSEQRTAAFLPRLAQQFAAQAFAARLASGHHAFGRGQDVDTHAAEHARNLGAAHVDAAAGTRYPRQVGDHGFIIVAVLQIYAQDLVALFFRRLEVRDIALFFEDAGYLRLQLGSWYIDFLVPGANRIADAREHVCDRIGQPHRLLLLEPPVRSAYFINCCGEPVGSLTAFVVGYSLSALRLTERTSERRIANSVFSTRTTSKPLGSRRATPVAGNTNGKCRTSADKLADVRRSCSGYACASRTSVFSRPSLVLLSSPNLLLIQLSAFSCQPSVKPRFGLGDHPITRSPDFFTLETAC